MEGHRFESLFGVRGYFPEFIRDSIEKLYVPCDNLLVQINCTVPLAFKVDRPQIIVVAKKYICVVTVHQ